MQQINLNLSSELYVNSKNQLSVHISSEAGNTLKIDENGGGLYAPATSGTSTVVSTSGTTYPNGEMEGIIIGAKGPWLTNNTMDYATSDTVVSVSSYVHRTYTALKAEKNQKGYYEFAAKDLVDMRKCDYISPGDFVRVPDKAYSSLSEIPSDAKYYYFIVVDASKVNDDSGYPAPYNDAREAYPLSDESW